MQDYVASKTVNRFLAGEVGKGQGHWRVPEELKEATHGASIWPSGHVRIPLRVNVLHAASESKAQDWWDHQSICKI